MARATRRFADGIARGLALAAVAGCLVLPRQAKAQAILAGPPEMQTVTLKGTVLGPDGQPVPEAQIGVITTPRFQTLDQLFSGKCNQAGEFEVVTPDLTQSTARGRLAAYWHVTQTARSWVLGQP